MAQQIAIYDQGCEFMVGVPPFCSITNAIIRLNRAQVRVFSSTDDGCLT